MFWGKGTEKAKPIVRWGRKAADLVINKMAGLPGRGGPVSYFWRKEVRKLQSVVLSVDFGEIDHNL